MRVDWILVLLVVAVLANLGLMAAAIVPLIRARRERAVLDDRTLTAAAPPAPFDAVAEEPGGPGLLSTSVPLEAYDRIVRVAAWTFILSTSVLVLATRLWEDTQTAILVLLAIAGFFVLLVHELLPPTALGTAKFVIEGSVAIIVVTLLIALTGQERSPFFFAYPLIVAGAALVVRPPVTVGLASVASLGYLLAIVVEVDGRGPIDPVSLATAGINLTFLILLAYVAMVVAREQQKAKDVAVRMSMIDPLTGLYNRAYFFAAVDREIQRSSRSGRGFCLVMMDLDGLKTINDRFGHFHGDRVLRAVAAVIRDGVRRIDTAARYGGDEFVVLLPETDPSGALVAAEKIRHGVGETRADVNGEAVGVTVSAGVVAYPEDGRTADSLLIAADQSMYGSKRQGKNRVAAFGGTMSVMTIPAADDARTPAGRTAAIDGGAKRADDPDEVAEAARPVRRRTRSAPRSEPARTADGPARAARRFKAERHDEDAHLRRTMDRLLQENGPSANGDPAAADEGDSPESV